MALHKKYPAFSLTEVLVALGILMVGLLGVMSLMIRNTSAQSYGRNYLIASMLAQEGIEMVRRQRDANWLEEETNWLEGIDSMAAGDFVVDIDSGIQDIDANLADNTIVNDPARLYLNGGFYTHGAGGEATPFYRLMQYSTQDLNGDSADDKLTLTALVEWVDDGKHYKYEAEAWFYAWY